MSKLAAISAASGAEDTAHADLERLYRPYSDKRARKTNHENGYQGQPLEAAHIPMVMDNLCINSYSNTISNIMLTSGTGLQRAGDIAGTVQSSPADP